MVRERAGVQHPESSKPKQPSETMSYLIQKLPSYYKSVSPLCPISFNWNEVIANKGLRH